MPEEPKSHPKYLEAVDALSAARIAHFPFKLPITYDETEDVFLSDDGRKLRFHRYGASYLSYHTRGNSTDYQRMLKEGEYAALAKQVQKDVETSATVIDLIAAMYRGQIVGVMASYRPIDNLEILSKIEEKNLSRYISGWKIDEMAYRLYLAVAWGDEWLVSLQIINGHSGHIAFSYGARFSSNDYEFTIPLVDHSRHLGKVENLLHNLNEILTAVHELEIRTRLEAVAVSRVWEIVNREFPADQRTEKMTTLINVLETMAPENALQFLCMSSSYYNTRGYKGFVRVMNDTIMKTIFDTGDDDGK